MRHRWMGRTIVLAAALAVGGVLVSGSAAAPEHDDFYTYTANLCASPAPNCPAPAAVPTLPGAGGHVDVFLSVQFTAASEIPPEPLDNDEYVNSVTINLPSGPALSYDDASITSGSGSASHTASQVVLSGLNLHLHGAVTVKLTLNTSPCVTGPYDWSGKILLDANDSGGETLDTASSSLTANPAGCHLSMETQPTDTVKNKHISDALYSSGGPVKVGLRDSSNNQLVTTLAGSVTASRSPGTGDPSSTLSGTTSKPLSGGVASFDDLSLDKTNPSDSSYKLDFAFTNPQVTSTTSGPFSIADAGQACSGGACNLPTAKFDSTGTNSATTSNASTSFNTAGGLSLTFFTSGIPAAVTGPGGGCANFTPTDSAGVTLKVTGTTGDVSIGYGISANALKKRYGPAFALAIAMPLVPICVGAQRVDAGGNRIPCESDAGGPWTGKALGANGLLNGKFKLAVCDAATHLWWSVVPNMLDKLIAPLVPPLFPPGAPPISIYISAFSSTTLPDGTVIRLFTVKKPNPWDYSMRG